MENLSVVENTKQANEQQKKCIEALGGPVVALAGPGTGKTFTLVERIDYMVNKKEIAPERILCMSFSVTASEIMAKKIAERIGEEKASKIKTTNYHSFCNELRQEFPFKFESNKRIVGEVMRKILIKRAFDEVNPENLKESDAIETCIKNVKLSRLTPETYMQKYELQMKKLNELKARIDEIEQLLLDYERELEQAKANKDKEAKARITEKNKALKEEKKDLLKTIDSQEKNSLKALSFIDVYNKYIELMDSNGYFDYEDMINTVVDELEKDKGFLDEVSGRYDYYLVDEYQDTNNVQNTLIFLLADNTEDKNIFIVGDDDQLLFRFQGAQTSTFKTFISKYSPKVIPLVENMRSSKPILDLANIEIQQDDFRLIYDMDFKSKYNISKTLVCSNKDLKEVNDKVVYTKYNTEEQEQNSVVANIQELIDSGKLNDKNGVPILNNVAIITKTNAECDAYAKLLKRKGIACELRYGKDIFSVKASLLLYFYMLIVVDPIQNFDKLLILMINHPFNFTMSDYEYFLYNQDRLKNCFRQALSGDGLVKILKNEFSKDWDSLENPSGIEKFFNNYSNIQRMIASKTDLAEIILDIANISGIINYYIKENVTDKLESILVIKKILSEAVNLFEEIPSSTLSDFVYYLNFAYASHVGITTDVNETSLNAVQLVTIHSSKGNEYEYVFLPNLKSNLWESSSKTYDTSFVPTGEIIMNSVVTRLKCSELAKYLFVAITRAKRYLFLSCVYDGSRRKLTSLLECITQDCEKPEELRRYIHFDYSKPQVEEDNDKALQNDISAITTVGYVEAVSKYKKEFDEYVTSKIKKTKYSVSQMNKYQDCPKTYMYNYIWGLKVRSSSLNNMDSAGYGNSVHYACEQLALKAIEFKKYPELEKFLSDFEYAITEREKFSSVLIRDNNIKNGKKNLTNFYWGFVKTIEADKIVYAEYPFNILVNPENGSISVREEGVESHDILVTGAIDLVVKNDDGNNTYTIYDYKTGGEKKAGDIKKGGSHEGYFNQLRMYKLAFEEMNYNAVKVTRAVIICPDASEEELCLCDVTPNLSENSNEEMISDFLEIFGKIKAKQFNKNEGKESRFCTNYCPYRIYCKNNLDEAIFSGFGVI